MQSANLSDVVVLDDVAIPRPPRLLATVRQMAARYPFTTEPGIRDCIYHAEPRLNAKGETIPANGLAPGIVRVPGTVKVLLDLDYFDQWIESGRMVPLPARDGDALASSTVHQSSQSTRTVQTAPIVSGGSARPSSRASPTMRK